MLKPDGMSVLRGPRLCTKVGVHDQLQQVACHSFDAVGGSVAEPDHEAIQVIALRDRVPPHPGRTGRYDIMSQQPA